MKNAPLHIQFQEVNKTPGSSAMEPSSETPHQIRNLAKDTDTWMVLGRALPTFPSLPSFVQTPCQTNPPSDGHVLCQVLESRHDVCPNESLFS